MSSAESDWFDDLVHLERDEFNLGKIDGLKDAYKSTQSLVDEG